MSIAENLDSKIRKFWPKNGPPSQEIDMEGITLTPQFWEKLVDAKKTQNKKVNIFLNKTIK